MARLLPDELPAPADPADLVPPPPEGGAGAAASPGQALFVGTAACASCHTIQGVAQGVLGPPLDGIASAAGSRISGYSAEEYIRESILKPSAYAAGTADGLDRDYDGNLMEATMAGIQLSDEDVDALVEYLLSLR